MWTVKNEEREWERVAMMQSDIGCPGREEKKMCMHIRTRKKALTWNSFVNDAWHSLHHSVHFTFLQKTPKTRRRWRDENWKEKRAKATEQRQKRELNAMEKLMNEWKDKSQFSIQQTPFMSSGKSLFRLFRIVFTAINLYIVVIPNCMLQRDAWFKRSFAVSLSLGCADKNSVSFSILCFQSLTDVFFFSVFFFSFADALATSCTKCGMYADK